MTRDVENVVASESGKTIGIMSKTASKMMS